MELAGFAGLALYGLVEFRNKVRRENAYIVSGRTDTLIVMDLVTKAEGKISCFQQGFSAIYNGFQLAMEHIDDFIVAVEVGRKIPVLVHTGIIGVIAGGIYDLMNDH